MVRKFFVNISTVSSSDWLAKNCSQGTFCSCNLMASVCARVKSQIFLLYGGGLGTLKFSLPKTIWCLRRGSGEWITPLSTNKKGWFVKIRSIQVCVLSVGICVASLTNCSRQLRVQKSPSYLPSGVWDISSAHRRGLLALKSPSRIMIEGFSELALREDFPQKLSESPKMLKKLLLSML